MPLFARAALFMFARSLVPGLGEVLIAAAAVPTMGNKNALAGNGEVGDGLRQ